jgi:hypothetical protein
MALTPTSSTFWTIQVMAVYEGPADFDNDGVIAPESAWLGVTDRSADQPVNIFLETIRDIAAESGAKSAATIAARTVLHEVVHRFGLAHGPGDEGVMVASNTIYEDDDENELTGKQLHVILVSGGPTS